MSLLKKIQKHCQIWRLCSEENKEVYIGVISEQSDLFGDILEQRSRRVQKELEKEKSRKQE